MEPYFDRDRITLENKTTILIMTFIFCAIAFLFVLLCSCISLCTAEGSVDGGHRLLVYLFFFLLCCSNGLAVDGLWSLATDISWHNMSSGRKWMTNYGGENKRRQNKSMTQWTRETLLLPAIDGYAPQHCIGQLWFCECVVVQGAHTHSTQTHSILWIIK